MSFVARAGLVVFAFAPGIMCEKAIAAPPFTIVPPVETVVPPTTVSGSCQNYNDQLSLSGAPLNGVNHPGYCQFSSGQITLNGMPFDQFWRGVSTGAVPPPYHVTYSQRGGMVCATATDLDLKISMRIQTSRLDWSGAMPVGMACLAEWNRRSPASLVSTTATTTGASNALSRLVGILSDRLPKSFEGCALPSPQRSSRMQPAFAALAGQVAQFMRQGVEDAQRSWSPQGVSGPACRLHCNLCSSGWAGTITGTKTLISGGQPYFHQTETFYVGGTSQNANRFLAEWTTVGGGTYRTPNNAIDEWHLNADVAGQCDPLGNAVCIQALAQANAIVFTEVNVPVVVNNAYQLTQTPPGGPSTTMSYAVQEDQINGLNPRIATMSLTDTMAEGQQTQTTNCQVPPQNPGTYSCTLLWEWHLFKQ